LCIERYNPRAFIVTPIKREASSLEERKFRSERLARARELRLKAREITAKEREVAAKETELSRSRWLNPTVLALFAAALGLAGNVVVARVNNSNSQEVERLRGQSNLVLEAIKTGNTDSACKNLVFFVGLGLVDDTNQTIQKQCSKAPVGPPSLPLLSSNLLPITGLGPIPGQPTIRGLVVDGVTSEPIEGAKVSMPNGLVQTTSSDGAFDFGVPSRSYLNKPLKLHTSKEGYLDDDFSLTFKTRIPRIQIDLTQSKP
jgi:hypothetical protein